MKMLRKIMRTTTIFLLWMTFVNMPAADGASISTNNDNTEGINETESVISNFLQQYGEEIRAEELKEENSDEQLTKLGDEEEDEQQQQQQQQQEANENSHVNVEVTQTENQVTEEKEETIEEELREKEDDKEIISLHTEEKENEEIDEKQGFEILEEESLENLGLLQTDDVEVQERKSYDPNQTDSDKSPVQDPDTVLEVTEGSECKGDDCDDNDFEGDQLVTEGRSADENIEDVSLEGETSEYYEDEESLEDDEFGGHSDDFGETHDLRLGDYEIAPGYAAHLGRKNGHRSRLQIRAWPDATIPYVAIVSDETNLKVERAMQHIRNRTCLNFRERTTEERYLHIKEDDGGCWTSSLGYPNRSKKVIVGLGRGCRSVTGVIHEVLHAAGFLHEHSRPDRDDFIEIKWGNILKNRRSQFRRDNRYSFINIPYDYKSVMHYGRKAFAVDQSKPTIVARPPLKVNLGGYRLSDHDVERINTFYNC